MHLRLSGGQILSEGFAPVCAFCCISEVSSVGLTGLPSAEISLVYARCSASRKHIQRNQLHPADAERRGDTVVTFTAQTDRPFYGRAVPTLFFHSSFTFAR